MNSVRKTALFVFSLEPNDRAWLLSQLDDEQRGVVNTALAELTQLGLDREDAHALFDETVAQETAGPVGMTEAPVAAAIQGPFEAVDPAAVVRVLRREHPVVAAAVLGSELNVFNQVVLARLPSRLRGRVLGFEDNAQWSTRVRDAARKHTADAAKRVAEERATQGALGWLRSVLK
jgi:flagellar motor switch protein FliG